jgi:hypothetical protein
VGVLNVKKCLSDTLYRLVQNSFPAIQEDLSQRLETSRRDLDALGPSRDTWILQKYYLDDIQTQYDALARKCLVGTYREDCSPTEPSRIRAHLNRLEEEFQKQAENDGTEHKYMNDVEFAKRIKELNYAESPNEWEANMLAKDDIFAWILRMWNDNRGDGLWYKPPPDFEEMLWKAQIKSWDTYARNYFLEASRKIQHFSDALLEETCSEPTIRSRVRACLQQQKASAHRHAEHELDTILRELERMKTCNRGYKETLQAAQKDLNSYFRDIGDNKLRLIVSTYKNLHDFQSTALWRFLDNVVIQVIERHLLGPHGLVFCFSVHWVRDLSEKEMDDIAGEDTKQRQKRGVLQTQVRELEEILRDSRMLQFT